MALHRLQSLGGPCGQSLPHEARARVQGIRSPNGADALSLTSGLRAEIELSRDSSSKRISGGVIPSPVELSRRTRSRLSRWIRMEVITVLISNTKGIIVAQKNRKCRLPRQRNEL